MKKLIHKNGNLLTAKDVHIVMHQANCQNVFGSGIARSIREMYPEAYLADSSMALSKGNVLGRWSYANVFPESRKKSGSSIHAIFNLYGQNLGTDHNKLFDRKTDYEALYSAMEKARRFIDLGESIDLPDLVEFPSVGLPYKIGSALGGGSWDIVERLIEVAFDGYRGDVIIYKFNP